VVQVALCLSLALGVVAPPRPLLAQPAATDKETKKKAAARFKEGEALFQKHAYAEAAAAFEDAYTIAPHPAVMLNAINAWSLAGQPARAATLSAKLISEGGTDEKSREEARSKMADLRGKVGRLEIRGAQTKKLTVDGKSAAMGEVFVDPGDHLLEAEVDGQKVQRRVTVVAGSSEQILLDAPSKPTAPTPTATAAPTAAPTSTAAEGEGKKGLPPTVVYVGGALTLVAGGITTWSGLDTLKAKDEFNKNRTDPNKEAGLAKQNRTNVLIGVTAVMGLATVGIALFATNWDTGKKGSAQLRVGPGSLAVEGTF